MPKRKKQTRAHRKSDDKPAETSTFWPLAGAILMIVLALFLLLGGFGTGGLLPTKLFNGVYWALGWGAYLTPIALVFFGIHKFTSEDRNIPLDKLIGMTAVLLFAASWFQVVFVSKQTDIYVGGNGGAIGQVIGNATLGVVDKVPAAILFFILWVLLVFLTFGISLKHLLKIFTMFSRQTDEDTDLSDLKASQADNGFKINEGVPTEHLSDRDRTRMGSLRNAAQKLAGMEAHDALTIARDPDWKYPTIALLNQKQDKSDPGNIDANAAIIKETLQNFSIDVEMEGANIGPRVTQYTVKPPAGVRLSRISTLDNNLALDLAAESIRIEAPIPGKRAVGIEVPNITPATVRLASIIDTKVWKDPAQPMSQLSFAVGKDIAGLPIIADLDKMPHILVAGQTNSGKSVMINTILASLLFRNSPSDLKLILVDPKHVELLPYDGIPHLLTSVITEPEKCISALKWAVAEMERRYRALAEAKLRNIVEYNELKKNEGMPYIVIVVDELADLMMMAAREVESLIVRIAQKARAVGIHLVLATQSPRVTVITGLIKANIPARIAFTVSQEVESRIIIGNSGAEKLLGKGDMLYMTTEIPKPIRVQGALIEIEEVRKLTDFLRMQRAPQYDDEVVSQVVQLNGRGGVVAAIESNDEPMFKEAVEVVVAAGKASTSLLQRRLRIGYSKAARYIESMEGQGIVGPADGARAREVLVSSSAEVFDRDKDNSQKDVYDDMPDDDNVE